MQSLHADISALRYELVDCRHMPQYDNGSFGAVLVRKPYTMTCVGLM